MRIYEGLFLVTNPDAISSEESTWSHVEGLLEKCGCKVVQREVWSDQRLAYDIKGQGKGTYYLVYFEGEPDSIDEIRREIQISEVLTRAMILRYDKSEIPEKSAFLAEKHPESRGESDSKDSDSEREKRSKARSSDSSGDSDDEKEGDEKAGEREESADEAETDEKEEKSENEETTALKDK